MPVEIDGLGELQTEIDELEDDFSGPTEDWVVGTNTEYAPHVEFGTSRHPITPDEKDALAFPGDDGETVIVAEVDHPGTDPQPFFRPAVNEVRLQGVKGFIRHNSRKEPNDIDSTREFLQTLAFALERRIKELAPVDTGTLRASIGAVPISDINTLDND